MYTYIYLHKRTERFIEEEDNEQYHSEHIVRVRISTGNADIDSKLIYTSFYHSGCKSEDRIQGTRRHTAHHVFLVPYS
jgi:hypothetical protein